MLLFWTGYVCVCSMGLDVLYILYYIAIWKLFVSVSKLAQCPLVCLADLAGDRDHDHDPHMLVCGVFVLASGEYSKSTIPRSSQSRRLRNDLNTNSVS